MSFSGFPALSVSSTEAKLEWTRPGARMPKTRLGQAAEHNAASIRNTPFVKDGVLGQSRSTGTVTRATLSSQGLRNVLRGDNRHLLQFRHRSEGQASFRCPRAWMEQRQPDTAAVAVRCASAAQQNHKNLSPMAERSPSTYARRERQCS